jgi:o-succinylbenzoate synthase
VKLEISSVRAQMRAPVVSSRESVSDRPLLLVGIEDRDGFVGYGEAAPLEGYDGVRIDDARAALEDCRAVLAGGDELDREPLLRACWEAAVLPQAVAAIDLALWDLAGRRTGLPVSELLGAEPGGEIEVNATIGAPDRAGAAHAAAAARAAGYRCVKVKVGLGDDAARLAAIRAFAGAEIAIRLDANGAWTVQEALATLRALQPVGIELCEEPVSGIAAIAEVSAGSLVPIAIDETTVTPGALESRACDAVCLKISRCGGISGVLRATHTARTAGYEVYLASTYDGPLGIAAALHAAAAIEPDRPCGLATLELFDRADPLPACDGRIRAPAGPGLGDGLLEWYR